MLFFIGCLVALGSLLSIYTYLNSLLIPKRKLSDLGPWLIITGCTDGIGKAYTKLIARRNNLNLILVGRSESKLEDLLTEIKNETPFSQKTKTVVLNFAQKDADYSSLKQLVSSLEIGSLIHCAGISYPGARYYEELTSEFIDELIDVNLRSAMQLVHLVLPQMKARNRGAIVCLGSGASRIREPLLVGYAAVKGGLASFCEALQAECREHNILVQCQTPLLVVSKLSKIKKPSMAVPSAEQFAISGLKIIEGSALTGLAAPGSSISPYWAHNMMLRVMSVLPRFLVEKQRLDSQKFLYGLYKKKTAAADRTQATKAE